MTRRITQKDGADAVAMLDTDRAKTAKEAGTTRPKKVHAPKVATPKATATASKPVPIDRTKANRNFLRPDPSTPSKAQRVRDLLDQGKTVNEVAKALDDVTWSYAWDVAAAWEKRTGKVVIASHAKAKAPRRSRAKGTIPTASAPQDKGASTVVTSAATEGGK